VFKDLTDELLDLTVVEKGFGSALYGRVVHSGGGGSSASSSACCCTICIWC
jgi:hypothetical protein